MSVILKKLDCDNDIEIFSKSKAELIKFYQQYNGVDNYNYDDVIHHINERGYFQFLIQVENEKLCIKDFYIDNNFRGKGIGKEVIKLLKELNYRIELEYWYGMPANNLYKSLGIREIKTRYMMD